MIKLCCNTFYFTCINRHTLALLILCTFQIVVQNKKALEILNLVSKSLVTEAVFSHELEEVELEPSNS